MATWTDGAAYAPIERPDGFATPEAEPLQAAPPQRAQTPGPMAPPRDFAPQGNVVPLAAIRTEAVAQRDPDQPFDVASSLLTAEPLRTGDRDPHQPFVSSGAPSDLPPPSGAPLALSAAGAMLHGAQSVPPITPNSAGASPAPPPQTGSETPPPASGGFSYPPPTPSSLSQPSAPHAGFIPARSQQIDTSNAQIQTLASVAFGIGFLVWGASPFLLLVGGGMLLRVPHRRTLAISALATAGVAILLTLADLQTLTWIAPVASLVFLIWSLTNRRPPAPLPMSSPWAR